ncbi:MAG: hypothetical protein H6510_11240 [Acidobacteria bacterium]|nr:hypothetical protein [Acidobacteriota bacterium]MCB9398379.1 hypothetical protein [Acidobacteriota bacterium]
MFKLDNSLQPKRMLDGILLASLLATLLVLSLLIVLVLKIVINLNFNIFVLYLLIFPVILILFFRGRCFLFAGYEAVISDSGAFEIVDCKGSIVASYDKRQISIHENMYFFMKHFSFFHENLIVFSCNCFFDYNEYLLVKEKLIGAGYFFE